MFQLHHLRAATWKQRLGLLILLTVATTVAIACTPSQQAELQQQGNPLGFALGLLVFLFAYGGCNTGGVTNPDCFPNPFWG